MFTFNKEVIDGVSYFTTVSAKGHTTMMFEMCGTVFVQVNRSAAKALADISKPSQAVNDLMLVFEA